MKLSQKVRHRVFSETQCICECVCCNAVVVRSSTFGKAATASNWKTLPRSFSTGTV